MSRFVRTFPSNAPSVGVLIFLTGYSASMAHLASAYSIVELIYVLYEKNILN